MPCQRLSTKLNESEVKFRKIQFRYLILQSYNSSTSKQHTGNTHRFKKYSRTQKLLSKSTLFLCVYRHRHIPLKSHLSCGQNTEGMPRPDLYKFSLKKKKTKNSGFLINPLGFREYTKTFTFENKTFTFEKKRGPYFKVHMAQELFKFKSLTNFLYSN